MASTWGILPITLTAPTAVRIPAVGGTTARRGVVSIPTATSAADCGSPVEGRRVRDTAGLLASATGACIPVQAGQGPAWGWPAGPSVRPLSTPLPVPTTPTLFTTAVTVTATTIAVPGTVNGWTGARPWPGVGVGPHRIPIPIIPGQV